MPVFREDRAGLQWLVAIPPLSSPALFRNRKHGSRRGTAKIYESEINLRISWVWDGGLEVRLGDEKNGFVAEETFAYADGILPWLQKAIAHFYPNSDYARSLHYEVKALAARRLFQPPRDGMRVRCPACGAPNAAPAAMEEQFAFICSHCGASVTVEPRNIQ